VDENGMVIRAIDADVLRQEINTHVVEGKEERYQFTWPYKKKSVLLSNAPIAATLRPCHEESVNFDTTENLYIEGDNLDVLKLLQETYLNRVKMIYIDPPYNTGNDFVYSDDFDEYESSEAFYKHDGQFDEDGNRMVRNLDSNGRLHTDWLNMIYPRLRLARDLLTDDGVLFISIDDNEVVNVQKICDEVYGSENKIGLITIQSNPRGSQSSKHLSSVHEYLLMYARNATELDLKGVSKTEDADTEYSEKDKNGRKFRLLGLRQRGGAWRKEQRPLLHYPIYVNPSNGSCQLEETAEYSVKVIPARPTGELGRWTWGKNKFEQYKNVVVGKPVNRSWSR
jgi:adenine-specific DNA-methyltransferase